MPDILAEKGPGYLARGLKYKLYIAAPMNCGEDHVSSIYLFDGEGTTYITDDSREGREEPVV